MELNEHHVLNNAGELEGLYTIDIRKGSFAHDDMWARIDQIVYEYYKLHPIEMESIIAENKQHILGQYRKHGLGQSKDMELRHHMRIPVGLLKALEQYEPMLFENRDHYHKFTKRYKALCAFSVEVK